MADVLSMWGRECAEFNPRYPVHRGWLFHASATFRLLSAPYLMVRFVGIVVAMKNHVTRQRTQASGDVRLEADI